MRISHIKTTAIGMAGLVVLAPLSDPALAWSQANRWGGTTSHTAG